MEQQNPGLPGVCTTIYPDVSKSYSDFSIPKEAAVPFADQNLGASYPIGTATMTNGQTQSVAQQHPVCIRGLGLHYLAEIKP